MKKGLFLALCLSFLLVSCGTSQSNNNSNGLNDNSSSQSVSSVDDSSISDDTDDNTSENVVSSSNEETQQKNKIDKTKISSARPFSEGKTFVKYTGIDNSSTEYCIDKEGNILFSVQLGIINESPGFYNGIATFRGTDPHGVCFCDEKGNITTPTDLGADEFLFDTFPDTDPALPFADGYFFAKKSEKNFEGNVHKAAIFNYKNHNFEKVVDFSTEIFDLYTKYIKDGECSYYQGYLYYIEKDWSGNFVSFNCLDLKTGKETHDYEDVLKNLTIENPSDFWQYDWDGTTYKYIDMITGETVIDLSKYTTISNIGDFSNGLAPIFFEVRDEVGSTNYFTLLKEDGSFAFDPIEVASPWGYYEDNGVYLIPSFVNNSTSTLLTFNINGKIAETVCNLGNPGNCYFEFSDGVINVDGRYKGFEFYNINLQPLF